MARTLLKEKPKAPETRRVRFHAPAALADRMDALVAQAQEAGFDLNLDAALAEAYGGILRKLERELGDAGVAVPTGGVDHDGGHAADSADSRAESAPAQAEPGGATSFGTAA